MRTREIPTINMQDALDELNNSSYELNNPSDLDPLMKIIGDSRYVLLGEASHGTHEYYTWRTEITKRLILEKNFTFIAVEGDWPDCYKLNRYIKGYSHAGKNAKDVLHTFNRWPTWMWANWEILELTEWLRKHNDSVPQMKKTGFFGLDVYSLWESMQWIINYLKSKDQNTLKFAERVMECFEPYNKDEGASYAYASSDDTALCEDEIVKLLSEIRTKIPQYNTDHEAVFSIEQNALVAVHAEQYYRAMIKGGPLSWNIRDMHMAQTLNRLMRFHGSNSKVIVWEHNTHIGDARATDMKNESMVNVGQLIKQRHNDDGVVRVGFGSYKGTVIAASKWGEEMKRMNVPPAQEGSFESILHHAGHHNKLLLSRDLYGQKLFMNLLPHRAIGVVYNPELERLGNYVPSMIPLRYEAFIYLDQTKALHPLNIKPDGFQIPETFPWGV